MSTKPYITDKDIQKTETARYRNYYENLSRAREGFFNKLKASDRLIFKYLQYIINRDKYYEVILEKMTKERYFTILDIGCGQGDTLACLSKKRRFNAYGIDLSLNQIKLARLKDFGESNFRCTQAAAQGLPFKSSVFDFVIFSEVIEHLPRPQLCIREIYRVMKENAILIVTTPNKYDYFNLIAKIFPPKLRKQLGRLIRGRPKDIDSSLYTPDKNIKEHIRLFSPFELKSLLSSSGLNVEKIEGGMLTVPLPFVFNRFLLLQRFWLYIDKFIGLLPLSFYFKGNFLIVAQSSLKFKK